MAENKESMGTVTQQVSNYDDDVHKSAHIKETNVASVALGKLHYPSHKQLCQLYGANH